MLVIDSAILHNGREILGDRWLEEDSEKKSC